MVEKCPAKYKNLNLIQSFSEQGYATIQLMKQACMNDEWLRQRVLKLNYLTPPAVRKWYQKGKWIDSSKSYGYKVNTDGKIVFNSTIEERIYIDFLNDEDLIDEGKTTAVIVSYDANTGTVTPTSSESDITSTDDEIDLTTIEQDADEDYDASGNRIVYSQDDTTHEIIREDLKEPTTETESNIIYRCQIPYESESEKYTYTTIGKSVKQEAVYDTKTATIGGSKTNSAWYVGFNKSKNYYVRPDWIKSWKDPEIPSVVRGQTFKATATGKLESVDLVLDYNGTHWSNTGTPLYVQVWNTHKANRVKTRWNSKTKKMEKVYKRNQQKKGNYNLVNGKYKEVKKGTGNYDLVYEKVAVPTAWYKSTYKDWQGKSHTFNHCTIYKPLGQGKFDPSTNSPFDTAHVKFTQEPQLKKGNTYFLALFSPLSEWKHCPKWAGWNRTNKDGKYKYGNAFLSEDNGRHWIRYGKNDDNVSKKQGKYIPQDFAFKCHIRTKDKLNYKEDDSVEVVEDQIDDASEANPCYLYLKPILTNPIVSFQIDPDDFGGTENKWASDGVKIRYDVSVNGRDWVLGITPFTKINLNEPSNYLFIRCALWRNTDPSKTITIGGHTYQKYYKSTPYINSINIILDTQLPNQMYVRTHEWQPPTDAMLGANIWGRIYAPYTYDESVNCSVEIVTNEKPTDHFSIIEVENVLDFAKKFEMNDLAETIEEMDVSEDILNDCICEYLYHHQEILTEFKQKNVYIKPYTINNQVCRLSFTPNDEEMIVSADEDYSISGFQINNLVAYPILDCMYTSENSTIRPTNYGEGYDFTFDYDNNILTLEKDVLEQLTLGDLAITYNKCFVKGLTNKELGDHIDEETGLKEQGLILDYFKETFIVTDENVETRRVPLKVEPVDPIREVVLNRDTDYEKELFEGFDYDVDIDNSELVFKPTVINEVSTSILKTGDVLEVVYTPNLRADGLSLGYWVTRDDKTKQCYIDNSYWEYKA